MEKDEIDVTTAFQYCQSHLRVTFILGFLFKIPEMSGEADHLVKYDQTILFSSSLLGINLQCK